MIRSIKIIKIKLSQLQYQIETTAAIIFNLNNLNGENNIGVQKMLNNQIVCFSDIVIAKKKKRHECLKLKRKYNNRIVKILESK